MLILSLQKWGKQSTILPKTDNFYSLFSNLDYVSGFNHHLSFKRKRRDHKAQASFGWVKFKSSYLKLQAKKMMQLLQTLWTNTSITPRVMLSTCSFMVFSPLEASQTKWDHHTLVLNQQQSALIFVAFWGLKIQEACFNLMSTVNLVK